MQTIISHPEAYPTISVTRLERADRQDTVVQMVQIYGPHGALEVTRQVLIKINRNDLVQQLSDIASTPQGTLWDGENETLNGCEVVAVELVWHSSLLSFSFCYSKYQ